MEVNVRKLVVRLPSDQHHVRRGFPFGKRFTSAPQNINIHSYSCSLDGIFYSKITQEVLELDHSLEASTSSEITNFDIFIMTDETEPTVFGFDINSPKIAGTICHETPYLSSNHPH